MAAQARKQKGPQRSVATAEAIIRRAPKQVKEAIEIMKRTTRARRVHEGEELPVRYRQIL